MCARSRKGDGTVFVSAAGQTVILPVTVESADTPDVRFVRDVEPLIAKLGCNAGTCHGSAKGKNGFKLSLRGYDPDFDYQALINDISGRRFNRVKPDESLMLLKPLGGSSARRTPGAQARFARIQAAARLDRAGNERRGLEGRRAPPALRFFPAMWKWIWPGAISRCSSSRIMPTARRAT